MIWNKSYININNSIFKIDLFLLNLMIEKNNNIFKLKFLLNYTKKYLSKNKLSLSKECPPA